MRQGLHGAGVTTLRSLEPWVGFKLGNNMEAKYSLASGLRPQASHEYSSGPQARGTGSNTSQGAGQVGKMEPLPQALRCPSRPL